MARGNSLRSDRACENRMEELIKTHHKLDSRKHQDRRAQAEIDLFCHNMDVICLRQAGVLRDKEVSTGALKRKNEWKENIEMARDGMMQGLAGKGSHLC